MRVQTILYIPPIPMFDNALLHSGPVLIGASFMTLMLSLEVCVRLYRANKREQDPELDNLTNPQEVKHWIDPRIIPFGWGIFDSTQFEKTEGKDVNCLILPLITVERTKEDQPTLPDTEQEC